MNHFETDWLSLREPADHRARNRILTGRLSSRFQDRPGIRVVDLGCGTGSTVRALSGLLPGPQSWRLVDHDEAHLARAAAMLADTRDRDGRSVAVETVRADLSSGVDPTLLDGVDLVTLSAFFDLVSRGFLERFAAAAAERGTTVYAALTVDGRLQCEPADPLDTAVFDAFNTHMTRDKGFGPALGPKAPETAIHVFRNRGFRVEAGRSDWEIGPDEPALAARLLDGWATAAGETGLVPAADLARWTRRRQGEIAAGAARLTVGHVDVLAMPA
ncbi:class I SAM-dependent methyltransferase [Prosthecomicrobium sp. N25]|uniref:class I SAM-dependent methyltransferase n=1 Tax=Prosthecomicrobium sp. N25 TaxID=3129254 RepID=UPI0030789FED